MLPKGVRAKPCPPATPSRPAPRTPAHQPSNAAEPHGSICTTHVRCGTRLPYMGTQGAGPSVERTAHCMHCPCNTAHGKPSHTHAAVITGNPHKEKGAADISGRHAVRRSFATIPRLAPSSHDTVPHRLPYCCRSAVPARHHHAVPSPSLAAQLVFKDQRPCQVQADSQGPQMSRRSIRPASPARMRRGAAMHPKPIHPNVRSQLEPAGRAGNPHPTR